MSEQVFTSIEQWEECYLPKLAKQKKQDKLRKEWGEGKFIAQSILQKVRQNLKLPIEYPELL